jgi:hypothetical protein
MRKHDDFTAEAMLIVYGLVGVVIYIMWCSYVGS